MDKPGIKKLIIDSLDPERDTSEFPGRLEAEGASYEFSNNFRDKVLGRIYSAGYKVNHQVEFVKYMNFAFYRVALTAVAAIILLLISIYFMEGSLSLNSFLGLNDNYDESIVCLLTGN